jgi:hypothetical protein
MTAPSGRFRTHDFIEVGNRRWCVNCDTFQTRRHGQWPKQTKDCAMDTPRARSKRFLQKSDDRWLLGLDT